MRIRELRELTRYRHKLVKARTSCKDQVHAVLAKLGIPVTCSDIFGVWGSTWLDGLSLPQPYAGKVASLRKICALLAAEIGDITRFPHPARLCSQSGTAPRHRESDTEVSRGHITKQGSRMLRWALIEAIQHVPAGHPLRQRKEDILARRGAQARNIAKVAMARQLLTWVYYAMRDGQARALATAIRQAG